MNDPDNVRLFTVSVYRSRPNAHQAPGGYWYVRIRATGSVMYSDTPITPAKAQELRGLGALQLPDGGYL